MTKTVDYYFSLVSPWTYLGDARMRSIADQHGATVDYKPVKLGVIFPETGGLPLAKRPPARQAYRLVELQRWSTTLGVPLNLHPKHFPAPDDLSARMVIAAKQAGQDVGALVNGILTAVWAEDRDQADADTLAAIAAERGYDGAALLAAAENPSVAETYDAYTQEALAAGVFGAPSYVIDGELFWGQDRLEFVDAKLAA